MGESGQRRVQWKELQVEEDLALVTRMRRGEAQAMAQFCSYYLPRLYRFALRRLARPEDADDVVQVVLSNAARRIGTYRGESTLLAWLQGICRREVSRALASAGKDRNVVSMHLEDAADEVARLRAPGDDEPEAVAEREQLLDQVREGLDRLPERQARALELKYVDGFSSREIAERLGISDDAVQSLLARARRTFREVCDDRIREVIQRSNGR